MPSRASGVAALKPAAAPSERGRSGFGLALGVASRRRTMPARPQTDFRAAHPAPGSYEHPPPDRSAVPRGGGKGDEGSIARL